jgi:hypothetical protein
VTSSEVYKKIINNKDMEMLQTDLNRLGEWAAENAIVFNPANARQFVSRQPE